MKLIKDITCSYMNKIEYFSDIDYIKAKIYYHIAPTLKGLKPSSIVTLTKDKRDLCNLWDLYKNQILLDCGLDYFELKRDDQSINVMVYNKSYLIRTIHNSNNLDFLFQYGYYKSMNLNEILNRLKQRFVNVCPHEVGIFLGYPIEDVKDFIKHPKKPCLITGYWKVYNDLDYAEKKFKSFDKAKINVMMDIMNGFNFTNKNYLN